MVPPFSITPLVLDAIASIERLIGRIEGLHQPKPQPHLRKSNRVRTVQGSLAIEGNTLNLDQVTALMEGKVVIGEKDEIKEVINAINVYDRMSDFDPLSIKSMLQAHGMMMSELVTTAGSWRQSNVGIMKGSAVSHIAPGADRVDHLMNELFGFLKNENTHPLIKGCVFHYELEFIHPFEDGNGRIGRFWHSLLLFHYHRVFEFIPVESLIKEYQDEYYAALEHSDKAGDSTRFIEFILSMIRRALSDFMDAIQPRPLTAKERLEEAELQFKAAQFSRKDYINYFKTISSATSSRDLKTGVEMGLLDKMGERAQTVYQYRNK
jgi:Fic family protein